MTSSKYGTCMTGHSGSELVLLNYPVVLPAQRRRLTALVSVEQPIQDEYVPRRQGFSDAS